MHTFYWSNHYNPTVVKNAVSSELSQIYRITISCFSRATTIVLLNRFKSLVYVLILGTKLIYHNAHSYDLQSTIQKHISQK